MTTTNLTARVLPGIDGITFLDGTQYVNNVFTNKLYVSRWTLRAKAG
ncbi:MAG: hypothetical protein ABSH24_23420 [Bryobacteraceae bacterium]